MSYQIAIYFPLSRKGKPSCFACHWIPIHYACVSLSSHKLNLFVINGYLRTYQSYKIWCNKLLHSIISLEWHKISNHHTIIFYLKKIELTVFYHHLPFSSKVHLVSQYQSKTKSHTVNEEIKTSDLKKIDPFDEYVHSFFWVVFFLDVWM